jgi:hypothetical protein
MRLRLLLSISPDEDLTAEDPYEVVTVISEPLDTQTVCYTIATCAPNGELRDETQFVGNAPEYPPRWLAFLALQALIQMSGKEGSDAAGS